LPAVARSEAGIGPPSRLRRYGGQPPPAIMSGGWWPRFFPDGTHLRAGCSRSRVSGSPRSTVAKRRSASLSFSCCSRISKRINNFLDRPTWRRVGSSEPVYHLPRRILATVKPRDKHHHREAARSSAQRSKRACQAVRAGLVLLRLGGFGLESPDRGDLSSTLRLISLLRASQARAAARSASSPELVVGRCCGPRPAASDRYDLVSLTIRTTSSTTRNGPITGASASLLPSRRDTSHSSWLAPSERYTLLTARQPRRAACSSRTRTRSLPLARA